MKDNQAIENHILEKYQVLKKLGSGAYGHVWKGKDKKSNTVVAIKKIFDAFQHSTDAQRTFRQISILRQLKNQKIIKLLDVIAAQNNKDIYLIFEFMESDLYHLIYQSKLQPVHIKYIMYQITLALNYLHISKLIHRDLKPSNILVNSDCSAKICDFGLVRYLGTDIETGNTMTQGVATRWYRAPEILLGSNDYGTQADMWSLGCVFAQILLKNPLFSGTCTTNQLQRILQFTGQPTLNDIKSIKAQLGQVIIAEISNGKIKKRNDLLAKIQDKQAVDLISKLLQFNPLKRLTAQNALKHPYFLQFFNCQDLIVQPQKIIMQIDENVQLKSFDYLKIIKQKFICNSPKKENQRKDKKKTCESPKSFSDLKKSRVSSNQKYQKDSSISKSRLKNQTSQGKNDNLIIKQTNLFKQLCKQKQKSVKKPETRCNSKQNNSNSQNSLKKQNHAQQNQKALKQTQYNNFQSFTVSGNTKKFVDEKKLGSFAGLRKVSKLNQK